MMQQICEKCDQILYTNLVHFAGQVTFYYLHSTGIIILACIKKTIKSSELKYSLKESLFYIE